jgi:hypothetical protein
MWGQTALSKIITHAIVVFHQLMHYMTVHPWADKSYVCVDVSVS